ncbi:MAG: hypothetical protein WBV18_13275, partial [Methyloceanibacter sp.]|uniref:hypothetical protein n=1 Tax=Methyloceanibacter sp. TaxID=1965321 RepID=UPI003C55F399
MGRWIETDRRVVKILRESSMFRRPTTLVAAAALAFGFGVASALADDPKDVLKNYADIAQAG